MATASITRATQKAELPRVDRNDLLTLLDEMKVRLSATEIFARVMTRAGAIDPYKLVGDTYKIEGLVALALTPDNLRVGLIDEAHWYSAEELLELWARYGTVYELARITADLEFADRPDLQVKQGHRGQP